MLGRVDGRDHRPEEKPARTAERERTRIRASVGAPGSPGVTIAAGSDALLSDEANALYRMRLRAAILFSAAGLALVQVRDALIGGDVPWQLQVAAILALAFVFSLLSFPRPLSVRRLKGAEVAIFGIMAAVLAIRQYHVMLSWAARGDEASFVAASKDTMIGSIILMFAYAMLIPNTWRGAWPFIMGIAACPVACEVVVFLVHPEVFRLVLRFAAVRPSGQSVLQVATAGVLATYGAHLVNTLRIRAIEARQLNQYRLREQIGVGGMGEVHLAEHRMLKRPCAIKLIRPERAGNPRRLEQFEHEVRATARLTHPNTVEIFDYGHTEDGTFYYVMEYLPGLSLEGLVAADGPLMPSRVIFLLRQACEALAEAHAAGMIHRDLKPANIFATQRGGRYDFVKLLDFGLVQEVIDPQPASRGRERAVSGTPAFMAPEQVRNDRPLDHRCDLYAMGAVAYHLLTGRPPFEGETQTRMLDAQVHDPVVPPSRLRPDVGVDLERVVLRCLAKAPEDRFASAKDLEEALAACAAASQWDYRKAAAWWEEFDRGAKANAAG
jgi:eukaryotic-like serine/threonine-protein kinase